MWDVSVKNFLEGVQSLCVFVHVEWNIVTLSAFKYQVV